MVRSVQDETPKGSIILSKVWRSSRAELRPCSDRYHLARAQQFEDSQLKLLLQLIGVMMVMVMVVVVGVHYNHHLRLRRKRNCEAEGENQSKQILFHAL